MALDPSRSSTNRWPAATSPTRARIGKRLTLDSWAFLGRRTQEIVGVASDVQHQTAGAIAAPMVYLPLAQAPRNSAIVTVRTTGDPLSMVGAVRGTVHALDPNQPLSDIQTLEQRLATSLGRERFAAIVLGIFAPAALLLTTAGLYAVLSFVVAGRMREMAIRMAVGATGGDVVALVLRRGVILVLAGTAIGVAAALSLSRLVASLLFGVSATDAFTYLQAVSLLTAVSLAACLVPAWRAMRAAPLTLLRQD